MTNPRKNKRIIVAGDSWSVLHFCSSSQQDREQHFAYKISIPHRLRQLGYKVTAGAVPGDSVISQLINLDNMYINDQTTHVILGWTDWYRDYTRVTHTLDLSQLEQRVKDLALEKISMITRRWPTVEWLHWGGLQQPWTLPRHPQHHLLFKDYSHSQTQSPELRTGLFSLAELTTSKRRIANIFLNHYPETDPKYAKQKSKQLIELYRWIALDDKHYWPDGGHLGYKYYDHLIEAVDPRIISPPKKRSNIANSKPK